MTIPTDEEIDARLAALGGERADGEGGTASTTPSPASFKYVKRLGQVSDSLIEALNVDQGIGLGLAQVDVLTRGFRPTDLVLVTGFAHSGKTQLVNTMLLNNPEKRVLFFSLDDPAEMILAKLVAMYTGIGAETLERRVKDGDEEAKSIIRDTATAWFQNLIVVDDVIGIPQMLVALDEARDVWGADADAVVIDYVEMMPGDGHHEDQSASVKQKMFALKGWAKDCAFPIVALHQGTRSNAKPGAPITLLSMGFSGEQQATIVIGLRRKRDWDDLEAHERDEHRDTVSVHVVKNKRPGGRMTHYDGIDFYMESDSGLIRPLRDTDLRSRIFNPQAPPQQSVTDAVRAVQQQFGGVVVNDQQSKGEAA